MLTLIFFLNLFNMTVNRAMVFAGVCTLVSYFIVFELQELFKM